MQIERILRRPEVEDITGLPCSSLYELMAEGDFPKNIPLHGRAKGWIASEVLRWVSERIEEAKKQQAEAEAEEAKKLQQGEEETEEQDKAPEQQDEEEEADEVVL